MEFMLWLIFGKKFGIGYCDEDDSFASMGKNFFHMMVITNSISIVCTI